MPYFANWLLIYFISRGLKKKIKGFHPFSEWALEQGSVNNNYRPPPPPPAPPSRSEWWNCVWSVLIEYLGKNQNADLNLIGKRRSRTYAWKERYHRFGPKCGNITYTNGGVLVCPEWRAREAGPNPTIKYPPARSPSCSLALVSPLSNYLIKICLRRGAAVGTVGGGASVCVYSPSIYLYTLSLRRGPSDSPTAKVAVGSKEEVEQIQKGAN